jgi:hypothetical protein
MQLIGRQRRKESHPLHGSLRRLAVRDGEHPHEALGQVAVAFDGQAPVPLRGGDRLAPEGDRTQRGRVGLERDRRVLGAAAGDVDGAVGGGPKLGA